MITLVKSWIAGIALGLCLICVSVAFADPPPEVPPLCPNQDVINCGGTACNNGGPSSCNKTIPGYADECRCPKPVIDP